MKIKFAAFVCARMRLYKIDGEAKILVADKCSGCGEFSVADSSKIHLTLSHSDGSITVTFPSLEVTNLGEYVFETESVMEHGVVKRNKSFSLDSVEETELKGFIHHCHTHKNDK